MADTTKVILLKGDKRNPESSEHIIKFPGGSIAVARTSDNEYWAHIEVNKRELLEDEVRGSKFGEITELYIKPEFRSKRIGEELISQAKRFARERGWNALEVGAPDLPRSQRTVNFYLRNGFSEIGPRLELNV